VGKARSLKNTGAIDKFFTRIGSDLTRKHKARLERPDKEIALANHDYL